MHLLGTTASARSRSTRSPHSARANRFFARSAQSAEGLRPAAIAAYVPARRNFEPSRPAIANASSRTRPGLQSSVTSCPKSSSSSSSSASSHSWFSASCLARAFASTSPSSSWRGIARFVLETQWTRESPVRVRRRGEGICFDDLQVRRVLLSLQLVVLAVGLTACGGDALSLDPVASAATKTVESGSSRVEFEVAMKAAGESVEMTGSGAFDYAGPRGTVTYRMQIPCVGDVSMDMRMLGTKLYLRLPQEIAGAALPVASPGPPSISASRSSRPGSGASTSPSSRIRRRRCSTSEPPAPASRRRAARLSAASRRRATSVALTSRRPSTQASTSSSCRRPSGRRPARG